MPARSPFRTQVLATLLSAFAVTLAGAADKPAGPVITNSVLDRQLFEQLIVGELELRAGDFSSAFQAMMVAARRTRDE